jgi:hypothetical protein
MSFYNILECNPNDSYQTIRKNYLRLALKYHPDKYPDNGTKFKEISEAYQHITALHNSPDNNNTIYQSPIDLVKEALSYYDNDLADVIHDTLSNIIPNTTNTRELWYKIMNIPRSELINSGTNLIKQYLDRKCKYSGHNNYKLNIKYDELKEENNINCSLDFLHKYSNIELYIDDEYITTFDLKYGNISIKFKNNLYSFYFYDSFPTTYKRINTYDLLLSIPISVSYINNIIDIEYEYLKNENLCVSINIQSTSDTYIIKNKGLWNPKINNNGDIYIHLSFDNTDNQYTIDNKYKQPDKIISIYDILTNVN